MRMRLYGFLSRIYVFLSGVTNRAALSLMLSLSLSFYYSIPRSQETQYFMCVFLRYVLMGIREFGCIQYIEEFQKDLLMDSLVSKIYQKSLYRYNFVDVC